ncbi:MAG: type II and III secretion system protein family protein [Hyphomicrobiaceae bacterium]|nr:type II and III secretion system protein family protein [Hyphomicrobiaceae bacterium]
MGTPVNRLKRLAFSAAIATIAVLGGLPAGPTPARADNDVIRITEAQVPMSRSVELGVSKSIVIELPRDVSDVLVSNPEVADAVVRTSRRVFIVGVEAGATNVFLFDAGQNQIAVLNINVSRDTTSVAERIRSLMPDATISVEGVGDGVVLRGRVANAAEARTALDIAARLVGGEQNVVNALEIAGTDQVFLRVTIAEIQRSVLRQLGINLGNFSTGASPITRVIGGGASASLLSVNPFAVAGQALSESYLDLSWSAFHARIQAMEQEGVVRTLAEPTLSAVSGESARFLAGGEFPVPVGRDSQGNIIIEFKPFGVGLSFTPVVLSEDRISLAVETEVSELTADGGFTLSGAGGDTLTIPGLRVRRANTTVELPSGGALVMAGLIDQRLRQTISGLPGLRELPILGALFRSRDYQASETELVIFLTPYLVRPTSPDQLVRPDDDFRSADDLSTIFLDRLQDRYGVGGARPDGAYHGHFGFIIQ